MQLTTDRNKTTQVLENMADVEIVLNVLNKHVTEGVRKEEYYYYYILMIFCTNKTWNYKLLKTLWGC